MSRKPYPQKKCLYCDTIMVKPINESMKVWLTRHKYCSKVCFDKYRVWKSDPKFVHKHTEEAKKVMSNLKKWTKASIETRRKMQKAQFKRVSEGRHNTYNNWATERNQIIRCSLEYKLWREAVFARDKRKCIRCGSNKNIQADHIKPFAYYPELRFAIDNGRTLCLECHKTTDTYANNARKYKPLS